MVLPHWVITPGWKYPLPGLRKPQPWNRWNQRQTRYLAKTGVCSVFVLVPGNGSPCLKQDSGYEACYSRLLLRRISLLWVCLTSYGRAVEAMKLFSFMLTSGYYVAHHEKESSTLLCGDAACCVFCLLIATMTEPRLLLRNKLTTDWLSKSTFGCRSSAHL